MRLTTSFLALLAAAAAPAQELTCDDIEFNSSATVEFPSVAQSCHSVVERSGELYVRLVAEVIRVARDGSMEIYLKARDGSRIRQDFKPPPGLRAMISGKPTPPRDLVRGQEIRFYLPRDRWQLVGARERE